MGTPAGGREVAVSVPGVTAFEPSCARLVVARICETHGTCTVRGTSTGLELVYSRPRSAGFTGITVDPGSDPDGSGPLPLHDFHDLDEPTASQHRANDQLETQVI